MTRQNLRLALVAIASLGLTAGAGGTLMACISGEAPRSVQAGSEPASSGSPRPVTRPVTPPASVEPEPALPALRAIAPAQLPTQAGWDGQIWSQDGFASAPAPASKGDRAILLAAIDHSLRYLNTDKAFKDYAGYPIEGITRDRVRRSLQRFRQLLVQSNSAEALQAAVQREFEFYQSTGQTGQNDAHFTGYFEPSYRASRNRTAEYRYPLFAKPANLETWPEPHPDRAALEGKDGLKFDQGALKGLELVWLKSRLEAFLVQVQGSAKLALTDGSTMSLGYAGRTNYPYVSVGRELVNDDKFTLEELSLPLMLDFFRDNPQALDEYLPRNPRFVFFQSTNGAPPTGSLGVPVLAERSIATDKSLLPPGALALITTQLPYIDGSGQYVKRPVSRFVLDQDTGGAIKGAGRADLFMGSGQGAGDRAGLINETGQLYYLMLKDGL
ncbi:MAG: murein transglycosylase [Synechococcales cyanobacterium RU_4_20]|nr:murein transglycosylase [Synechococcales cyanobacterium RU_4_20]NJR68590.1 murein transglycosylase [Synechococcales cyanobacterium CRU_2_2]